jgi:hypothetical protein
MRIGVVGLAIAIAGGGASFFLLRAKGPVIPDAKVAQGTNVSNTVSAPTNEAPANSALPTGTNAGSQNKQSSPAAALSATAPSRGSANTNVVTVPQQQPPKSQASTAGSAGAKVANPAPAGRTEMALNNPAPPPVAERPSQPVAAANPQPVVPTLAPAVPTPAPAAVAATPTPAPKAAEPAAPAKAAEPAPVVASSEKDSTDRQAINVSLQQLSTAFSNRNINEVEELWPKGNKNTMNALKTVFSSVKSMTREFHPQSVTISPDGNSATAIGAYQGKFVDAKGVETPNSGNFYVRFGKRNGRWFIDDASF